MAQALADHATMRSIQGSALEVREGGQGSPLLLLHGAYGWWGWETIHERLAERFTVVAPSLPGFGRSDRLDGIDTVDDLAYYLLDHMAELTQVPARIMGFGLGGWLALEVAVRCPHLVEQLTLVGSVGIKISDRETRDIGDPFILVGPAQQAMLWQDPERYQAPLPVAGMDPALLEVMLRNQEAAMLFGWKPFMHNPKLRQRLHRVTCPTLVVWGSDDRVVSSSYGRALANEISGSRFVEIPGAGHYPHREQVEAFVSAVSEYLS
jgi:pimeloyl-ACP methyl ester carboxylesterase